MCKYIENVFIQAGSNKAINRTTAAMSMQTLTQNTYI